MVTMKTKAVENTLLVTMQVTMVVQAQDAQAVLTDLTFAERVEVESVTGYITTGECVDLTVKTIVAVDDEENEEVLYDLK